MQAMLLFLSSLIGCTDEVADTGTITSGSDVVGRRFALLDCEGTAALWYHDADRDGHGDATIAESGCVPPWRGSAWVRNHGDCDDTDPDVSPDAWEECDGIDNDCDGDIDEDARDEGTWYADTDGDGFGDAADHLESCEQPSGYTDQAGDCDDSAADIHPSAEDVLDGIDNDCDNVTDEINLSSASAKLIGEQSGSQAGESVSGAGDLNGDGLDDLIIGAPHRDGFSRGAAYILLSPLSGDVNLSSADVELRGDHQQDKAGESVSGAGDVNGDGYDDVLIGASGEDTAGNEAGAAYLVYGPVTWVYDLAQADTRFYAESSYDGVGESVSGAGDVNGDGFDDVLIGAPGAGSGGPNVGTAYLQYGPFSGGISLSEADAILVGAAEIFSTAASVSGAGDVDADGFDDILIGANQTVYLMHGPVSGKSNLSSADVAIARYHTYDEETVSGAGDVNGDGYDDVLVGVPDKTTGDFGAGAAYLLHGPVTSSEDLSAAAAVFIGLGNHDNAGRSVSDAGDVNGDGFDDVLIGAPGADSSGTDTGAAYLLYGPISGSLDSNSADALFDGEFAGDAAGHSVSGAGDVDGDGLSDVLIGATGASSGDNDAGVAYLFTIGAL